VVNLQKAGPELFTSAAKEVVAEKLIQFAATEADRPESDTDAEELHSLAFACLYGLMCIGGS